MSYKLNGAENTLQLSKKSKRYGERAGHHRGQRPGHVFMGVARELGRANCLLVQSGMGKPIENLLAPLEKPRSVDEA